MKSLITKCFKRARVQASSEMLFTASLSTDATKPKLVVGSDVSVHHIDSMFRDQAIHADSQSQLNV
jgi:hypothetical protein